MNMMAGLGIALPDVLQSVRRECVTQLLHRIMVRTRTARLGLHAAIAMQLEEDEQALTVLFGQSACPRPLSAQSESGFDLGPPYPSFGA